MTNTTNCPTCRRHDLALKDARREAKNIRARMRRMGAGPNPYRKHLDAANATIAMIRTDIAAHHEEAH